MWNQLYIDYLKQVALGGADEKLDVVASGLESDVFDGGAAQGR